MSVCMAESPADDVPDLNTAEGYEENYGEYPPEKELPADLTPAESALRVELNPFR